MREIKFRTFKNNMMSKPFKFGEAVCFTDGSISVGRGFELMQFTGLKDVNGVEIYEGDYVSVFTRDDNEFMMCGVVKFGFRGYPGFDIYTRGDNTYSDEYNTFTNDDDLYFKVVGNKYQNPELLK